MLELNIGNKWSVDFLSEIAKINANSDRVKVTSMYGDPLGMPIRGVRPSNRLPVCDINVHKYIEMAEDKGISINLTLNKPCTDAYLSSSSDRAIIEYAKEYSAHKNVLFTVASPYIMSLLSENSIPFEISTIVNQSSVNIIAGLLHEFDSNVKKVCLPLYMNRDFARIKSLIKNYPDTQFEALANEFCVSQLNNCHFRTDCYNVQSHGILTNYYFEKCSKYRELNPVAWMIAPTILPEWMGVYEKHCGLNSFKLTGRTLPTKALLLNVQRWVEENSGDCDIRELWGAPLPGQTFEGAPIPARKVAMSGLIGEFINSTYVCDKLICGVECMRCHQIFDDLQSQSNFFSELDMGDEDGKK